MGKISILYLEDNLLDIELVDSYLENEDIDYSLDPVSNEKNMKEKLRKGAYDLFLSDYQLPDYDGIRALKYVQEYYPNLPVIIISGTLGEESAIETLKKGATDYVLKQNIKRLAEAIKRALREAKEHTKRLETENQLKESEIKYRRLFESSNDAVVIHDLSGKIVDFNSETLVLFSKTKEQLRDHCFYDLIEESSEFHKISETKVLRCETRLLNDSDRPVYIDISSNIVELKHTMVQSVIRDVSEKRMLEEKQKQLIQTLEAKNTELEKFNYIVSHDLKTPLFTINGFLGMLQEDCIKRDHESVMHDVHEIKHAVDHMAELLKALQKYSKMSYKIEAYEKLQVNEIVEHVRQLVQGHLVDSSVEIKVDPDIPNICGDRVRLIEVFMNLIDNAIHFMGDQPNPTIQVGGYLKENHVVIFVHDNGIGIDAAYLDNVFGLFNKLDHETAGTGMGLTIAKQIVELHQGEIWVESDGLGKGSTFYFSLPDNQE